MSSRLGGTPGYPAISLFSGAGIGDLGFRAAGFDFLSLCEVEPDRAALARLNYPQSHVFVEDVNHVRERQVALVRSRLAGRGEELFLVTCTAPCQGMSRGGQGTLLKNVREGLRPALDPRNRLILPALAIIRELRPRWVVFENVVEMRHTVILDDRQQPRRILDVVFEQLGDEYAGEAYDVEFADHGIPQRRQRLITVLTRDDVAQSRYRAGVPLIPPATHAKSGTRTKWVSVMEAIGGFPPLDGKSIETATHPGIPFHRVPVLDPKKYEWIRHTPPGKSAFDNQCIQTQCGYQGNRTHGASHNGDGINRSHKDTPLYCEQCGTLLPRPFTQPPKASDSIRLMSGYTSAYKRMDPDLPASTLTRNLSYPCSDQKLHPYQNRVLSLAEAMTIHTLDRYDFRWGPLTFGRSRQVNCASDSLIRLVIGESVPPFFLELLGRHVLQW